MNRADRRAIERLPVDLAPWQARFAPHPLTLDGVRLLGTLCVTGAGAELRVVGPVGATEPDLAVRQALLAPASPAVPTRPSVVVCADDETRSLLERAGLKATFRIGPTPAVDDTLAGLQELAGAVTTPPIPGLTVETARWKQVLERLCRRRGWRALDGQPLSFVGERALERAKAFLVGDGGSFSLLVDPEGGDAEDGPHWRLELCELAELEPDERGMARKGGWTFAGGLVPCAFAADPPPLARPLDAREQRRLLAAAEAIALLCEDPGAVSKTADTTLGRIEVRRPVPKPTRPWIVGDRKSVLHDYASATPMLLLSQRKADALITVLALGAVTEVAAIVGPDGQTRLEARANGIVLGDLATFSARLSSSADTLRVVVQQGGARGDFIRRADVLLDRPVKLIVAREQPPDVRVDPVFLGPADRWPKASAAVVELMRFAAGDHECGTMPDDAYRDLAMTATAVYSAVAAADHWHDPSHLNELRRRIRIEPALAPMIESMIAEKRRRFGGDPRMGVVDRVVRTHDERVLHVLSAMPPHLR